MVDLEHLAKEFEKVHDALPLLLVRLAVTETWQAHHPETHRLEGVALEVAKQATDTRLASMNELRKQIETERGIFPTRELLETKVLQIHRQIEDNRVNFDKQITDARINFDKQITDLRSSRDTMSGEKGLLEKFWPLFLAALMYAVGHFWK